MLKHLIIEASGCPDTDRYGRSITRHSITTDNRVITEMAPEMVKELLYKWFINSVNPSHPHYPNTVLDIPIIKRKSSDRKISDRINIVNELAGIGVIVPILHPSISLNITVLDDGLNKDMPNRFIRLILEITINDDLNVDFDDMSVSPLHYLSDGGCSYIKPKQVVNNVTKYDTAINMRVNRLIKVNTLHPETEHDMFFTILILKYDDDLT